MFQKFADASLIHFHYSRCLLNRLDGGKNGRRGRKGRNASLPSFLFFLSFLKYFEKLIGLLAHLQISIPLNSHLTFTGEFGKIIAWNQMNKRKMGEQKWKLQNQ